MSLEDDYANPVFRRHLAERARHELTLGAIRADLEEKPTPGAVRAAARRWCRAITAIGEDVANQRRQHAA